MYWVVPEIEHYNIALYTVYNMWMCTLRLIHFRILTFLPALMIMTVICRQCKKQPLKYFCWSASLGQETPYYQITPKSALMNSWTSYEFLDLRTFLKTLRISLMKLLFFLWIQPQWCCPSRLLLCQRKILV